MHQLLAVGTLLLFISCATTTEDKIKQAVTELEKNEYKKAGRLLSVSVDNVKYDLASMTTLYLNESKKQLELQPAAGSDPKSSDLRRIKEIEENYIRLKLMAESADTAKNMYLVNYRLKVKTDKQQFDQEAQKYLSIVDLKEVQLDPALLNDNY